MTAFTRQHVDHGWGTLVWELRSVNHRYLEPSIRLPDMLRQLEGGVREQLRRHINRGKVEAQLKLALNPASSQDLPVNQDFLKQLIDAESVVRQQIGSRGSTAAPAPAPVNTLELLRWPGVIQENERDTRELEEAALSLLQQALDDFNVNREREGSALVEVIHERLKRMNGIVDDIETAMPEILDAQKQRLRSSLKRLFDEGNEEILEREMVLLAQKADIDEELDRLKTHLREVSRTLDDKGPIGRRVDFLLQELNREANTICSKAVVTETTHGAVELKVLIEQVREQVQNIE